MADADGNPVPCSPENIDQFMLIEKAQEFVFARVKSLRMHFSEEKAEAKKD